MNQSLTTPDPATNRMGKWALFFALAYATQGFAQTTGILLQPIQFFYKDVHAYDPEKLAALIFWISFPWFIKPVYGLLADFIPLFGFRRRSYLILSCVVAFIAFTVLLGIRDPILLAIALTMTALCTAVGDVMVDALMVEHGQRLNKIKEFQSIQWIVLSILAVLAALGGGALAQYGKDSGQQFLAVQLATGIAMLGPIILLIATLKIVREPRSELDREGIARTAKGFRQALRSKALLGVLVFVCLFWFQPGISATMYVHTTETLEISERAYGISDALAKAGYIVGAALFMLVLGPRLTTRQLATLSVLLYAGITLAYLGLRDETTLYVLGFCYGFCYMICNLTLLSLAAQVCPHRVEGFVFAFLMGLMNFVRLGSDWVGGVLYGKIEPVYSGETTEGFWASFGGMPYPVDPLIIISAAVTLVALFAIPLLPKREQAEDVPIEAV